MLLVSGEVRFALRSGKRLSPYATAGAGGGISRPNVNDLFPERVTNAARALFSGGGVVWRAGAHLLVAGEADFLILAERDVVGLILPVRGSLAWRF